MRASERPSERYQRGHQRDHQRGHRRGHRRQDIRSGIRGAIKEAIKEAREVIKSPSLSSSKQQRADVQRAATSSVLVSGQMSTLAIDRGALRGALIGRLVVANTVLVLEAKT